jgi:serine O-acetyltransferase
MSPFSNPFRSATHNGAVSEARSVVQQAHGAPPDAAPRSNQNPREIGLLDLLLEDFRVYDRSVLDPGFWAVAVHRLGNARLDVKHKLVQLPLNVAYCTAAAGLNRLWGIDLPETVKLGRRVRIWHHGGVVLDARSIGDDVHIRHNTTLGHGTAGQGDGPVIGNRVEIGVGACVLGAVTVGDDCVIGANSVVLRDLPPASTAFGVPARPVNLKANEAQRPTTLKTPKPPS